MTHDRRKKSVAEAKARYDVKKRKEGKTKAQIWLDSDDRQNISIIKKEVGLTTQSQAISHALSVTVALGSLAQESVQSDQIDAQDHVQHIDK